MNDRLAGVRRGTHAWRMAAVLAALFLLGHVPFLASTLEDVDSLNFALGVRHFDPALHRPHPPGYPVYIALSKLASTVMSEPHALSVWGALFGAFSAFALLRIFACLDALDHPDPAADVGEGGRAWWPTLPASAVLLTLAAPLMWMTASRPMSDTAGLAATLAAQALLLTAMVRQRTRPNEPTLETATLAAAESGRVILYGAFASAVALGVRSQAAWLLLPLWMVVLVARDRRTRVAALVGSLVWFAVGVSLWLVPLMVAAGGPSAYLTALGSQAGEDWSGVDLLATNFSVRRLAFGLQDTFIVHWAGLGWLVLAAALAGGISLIWRGRRGLLVIVAASVPYLLFHLMFQETFTTRYALPLVPPVVYLAVRGLFLPGARLGSVASAGLAAASMVLVVPATAQYSRSGSPAADALADIRTAATSEPGVVLAMHHAFSRSVEVDSPGTARVLPSPPKHEWLQAVNYWSGGGDRPAWFLADPGRTDLALIDSRAQRVKGTYEWPFSTDVYLGGIRPDRLNWVEIRDPGWYAGEGWSLTPETAGVARADRRGLDHGAISVQVRRRPGPAALMIGGRHLGRDGDPPVLFRVQIDGRDIAAWTATLSPAFFLRVVNLDAGTLAGDGRFATLQIDATLADGSRPGGRAAIEQFDLQDAGVPMLGFEAGWHEPEYNPSQGRSWRWTSRTSTLRITPGAGDITIRVAGEGSKRYFPRPSRVVVRAGSVVLLRAGVTDDFAWVINVPAAALQQSDGTVTIETDQVFRPADRGPSADKRDLGLRIYSVSLMPSS